MGKQKIRSFKKVVATKICLIVIIGLILGISCFFSQPIEKFLGIGANSSYVGDAQISQTDLSIHYIDVGQGDSTFIHFPDGKTMLIDAGKRKAGDTVVDYLKGQNVEKINYFVLTHSDEDHVGGAVDVLENFEVETIYRPFQISVNKDNTASESEDLGDYLSIYPKNKLSLISTATYRNFITAAYSETYDDNVKSKIIVHYDGIVISGAGYTFEFFAPLIRENVPIKDHSSRTEGYPTKYYSGTSAESINASSPVMLLEYKTQSFVFTGDATEDVERDVIDSLEESETARFKNIDVFQAGHHGSKTSNCQEFLSLMTPAYTVVSVGKDNSYGHPTPEFLERLQSVSHTADYLLRTDEVGSVNFGYHDGQLVYSAIQAGQGVVVRWWYIALGTFVVLTIIILSVKVRTDKTAEAEKKAHKKRLKYYQTHD